MLPLSRVSLSTYALAAAAAFNQWYIEQLESHFGDQVAFFFAFSNYYTVWLIGPAILGFFVTAVMAFGHDKYLMALAVFGLGMPAVWGTSKSQL